MSFFDKAREAAERATQQAKEATQSATQGTKQVAGAVTQKMTDPATKAQAGLQARRAGAAAKRSLTTLVEKIDPRLLADLIIKSTALQERTNLALKEKGSAYRIGQVEIVAAIPPQVSFAITRVDDVEEKVSGEAVSSVDLVEEVADELPAPVLTLDGSAGELDAFDEEETDDGGAS